MSTLEARIAAIEDRQAITDLILRHAEYIRSGRAGDQADLFVPDAYYELRHFDPDRPGESTLHRRIEGIGEIVGSKDEVAGADARLWPQIHNIRIALDGDRASSSCVSMTTIWPMGIDFVGEYRDSFRRVDGAWRFASRSFILFGRTDGSFAAQAHDHYEAMKQ